MSFVSIAFSQELQYSVTLTKQDVLDTIAAFKTDDPSKTVESFKAKMPLPITDKQFREKVFQNSPKKIFELQIKNSELETKVRNLVKPVVKLYERENIYEMVIFKHPSPFISIDTGVVILISTGLLAEVESDDELLGAIAHEVGHEYFIEYSIYTKHLLSLVKTNGKEIALAKKFGETLSIIELQCDAFSSITLAYLGYDPTAFIDGLERMTKKFKSEPNSFHPNKSIRRKVIESVIPKPYIKKDMRKLSEDLKQIKEIIRSQ